jgi:hypothetical protein
MINAAVKGLFVAMLEEPFQYFPGGQKLLSDNAIFSLCICYVLAVVELHTFMFSLHFKYPPPQQHQQQQLLLLLH